MFFNSSKTRADISPPFFFRAESRFSRKRNPAYRNGNGYGFSGSVRPSRVDPRSSRSAYCHRRCSRIAGAPRREKSRRFRSDKLSLLLCRRFCQSHGLFSDVSPLIGHFIRGNDNCFRSSTPARVRVVILTTAFEARG